MTTSGWASDYILTELQRKCTLGKLHHYSVTTTNIVNHSLFRSARKPHYFRCRLSVKSGLQHGGL